MTFLGKCVQISWTSWRHHLWSWYTVHVQVLAIPVQDLINEDQSIIGVSSLDGWTNRTSESSIGAIFKVLHQLPSRQLGGSTSSRRVCVQQYISKVHPPNSVLRKLWISSTIWLFELEFGKESGCARFGHQTFGNPQRHEGKACRSSRVAEKKCKQILKAKSKHFSWR